MINKTACTSCCADIELDLNKNCRLVNAVMEQDQPFTVLKLEFEYYCAKCGAICTSKYVHLFNTETVKDFSMQELIKEATRPHSWLRALGEQQ